MVKLVNKKFAWLIKNFSSINSDRFQSAPVVIGNYKWHFYIHPKGENKCSGHLSLYLEVDNHQSLPLGWRRYAKFRFTIVNQHSKELSEQKGSETELCFDQKVPAWGFREMFPLTKLHAKDGGFLVNDELLIVADVNVTVDVVEVIGTLDEYNEASKLLKNNEQDDDGVEKTSTVKESVDVNGFQVHPSQVESARHIFEMHPDIASEFRGKNQQLRTTCMNFLVSLTEMLRQSVEELSYEDLEEADIALGYLKNASFKVDWLEIELDQVKEKKEAEQAQA